MKITNKLTSDIKLDFISFVYIVLSLFYVFTIVILLFTSGTIKQELLDNISFVLLPLLLPLLLSFIGLRRLKFDINSKYIKFTSDCIFMSYLSDNFSDKTVLKKGDYNSNYESTSILGFKRELVLLYKKNDQHLKKKINISFLSSLERQTLLNNLMD